MSEGSNALLAMLEKDDNVNVTYSEEYSWLSMLTTYHVNFFMVLFYVMATIMGSLFNVVMAINAYKYRNKSKFPLSARLLSLLGCCDLTFCLTQGLQSLFYFVRGVSTESEGGCLFLAMLGVYLIFMQQTIFIALICERIHSIVRPIMHYTRDRNGFKELTSIIVLCGCLTTFVFYFTSSGFDMYRGKCWIQVKSASEHKGGILISIFMIFYGMIPISLTLFLFCLMIYLVNSDVSQSIISTATAFVTLLGMGGVYSLGYTMSALISIYTITGGVPAWLVVMETVVSLLTRTVTPIVFSQSLRGFSYFCLTESERVISNTCCPDGSCNCCPVELDTELLRSSIQNTVPYRRIADLVTVHVSEL